MGNLKIVLIIHSENLTEIKLTTYSMIFFSFGKIEKKHNSVTVKLPIALDGWDSSQVQLRMKRLNRFKSKESCRNLNGQTHVPQKNVYDFLKTKNCIKKCLKFFKNYVPITEYQSNN